MVCCSIIVMMVSVALAPAEFRDTLRTNLRYVGGICLAAWFLQVALGSNLAMMCAAKDEQIKHPSWNAYPSTVNR